MTWSDRWPAVLACAVASTLGCSREPEPPTKAATEEQAPSTPEEALRAPDGSHVPARASEIDVRAVLEPLGDEGAAVVLLRPEHWTSLHGALAPWLATLPPRARALAEAAREPATLPELLAWALELPPGSVALEGWDPSRPIVASLGEVPYDGPPGAVTPQLPVLDGWVPPVRHQLWLPATDPAVLTASLGAALERVMTKHPALVEGREGARAVRNDDLTIALLPEIDAVRAVVFHGAVGSDDAALIAHMRDRLDVEARASVTSPALDLFARPDAVLGVWLRPWRLRPLAAWWGAEQTLRALATVDEGLRAPLLARGLQLVLDTETLMTDEGAELDDAALSLVVDQGVLRLRLATSPTAEGEALLDAAAKGAGRTHAVAVDDAWIDAVLRADARAMLEATAPPPGLPATEGAAALARALSEGGGMAVLYMGLRHPFGVVRTLEQQARTERLPLPIEVLPTAVQVVWRGNDGDVPRVALSVQWPKSYVDRPLAGMVPIAKREPGFETLRMDTLAPHGRPITVFGLGGEGSGTFDTSTDDGFEGLVRARVSLARIGADVATRDPERGAMLAAAGEVRATIEHRTGALLAELAWAPAGSAAPEPKPVPVTSGAHGGAPRGAPVNDATRCLAEAGRRIADGLDAVASVADDQLGTVVAAALLESEPSLRCAADDPGTADAARGLRRLLVRLAADAMVAKGRAGAARELLRGQCEQSKDAELCERVASE